MKIIQNKILPPKGFKAINLFGILFCRDKSKIDDITKNHEAIHTEQMKEMLYIPFYVWYLVEWLLKSACKENAYKEISFEKEAYDNQDNLSYIDKRKRYNWLKRVFE